MSTSTRNILGWIVATATLSAAIHFGTIVLYPRVYTSYWHRRAVALGGSNQFLHAAPPTAEDRDRPRRGSPDLAYSAMAYDLSDGPLRVTIPLTSEYMSISLYAANTDNFFVLNDTQVQGRAIDFVLVGSTAPDASAEDLPMVLSPSRKGIALLRFLVTRPEHLGEIEAARQGIRVSALR